MLEPFEAVSLRDFSPSHDRKYGSDSLLQYALDMHTAVAALYAREDAEMPSQVLTTARRQASVSSRSLQSYRVRSADYYNRSL